MSQFSQRAVIYARISEDPLHLEKGVTRQIEDAQALAAARGWEVVAEPFVDNNISALTGKHRPAYDQLMALVASGGCDRVITYMTSRLWRNRGERADGIEKLRAAAVGVVAVQGPDLDLTTAAGRMLAGLLGEFDTHESEVKAERISRASQQRAEEGRPNGGVSYGWERVYSVDDRGRVSGSGDKEKLSESVVVREIVDRLLSGDSLHAITRALNERGLPSPQGKPWGISSVRKIALRESNVARRVHQGKVIGAGSWPALVDQGSHDRVRALLEAPDRGHTKGGQRRHLLSFGIGECGVCHGKLRAQSGKRHRKVARAVTPDNPEGRVTSVHQMYVCIDFGCVGRNQGRVDELLGLVIAARLERPDAAGVLVRDNTRLVALQAEAEAVRSRLDTAADDYADGGITSDQLRRITARLCPQLEQLEKAARIAAGPALEALQGLAGEPDVLERWRALSVTRQRAVLAVLGLTVSILPAGRGPAFNPECVAFVWAES